VNRPLPWRPARDVFQGLRQGGGVLSDEGHPWHQFIGKHEELLSPEQYPQTMRHVVVRAQLWKLLIANQAIEKALGRCLSIAPWEMAAELASALALREEVPADAQVAELVREAEAGFTAAHKRWIRRVLRTLSEVLSLLAVECPKRCCADRLELHRSVPLLVDLSHTAHALFLREVEHWLEEPPGGGGIKRTIPTEEIDASLVWAMPDPVTPPLTVTVLPGETPRVAVARARREAKRPGGRAPWKAFTEDGLYQRYAVWLFRHRILGESKRTLARDYRTHGDARKTITRGIRLAELHVKAFDPKILELIRAPTL
jgi:hypothetical protein